MLTVIKYVLVICVGWVLRRRKILNEHAVEVLTALMFYVTLPAAMAAGTFDLTPDFSLFILTALSVLMAVFFLWMGRRAGKNQEQKAIYMIEGSTLNLGGFAIPFMQGLLPSPCVAIAGMYDFGNAIFANGASYSVVKAMGEKNGKIDFSAVFRKMARSVPIMVYLVFLILAFLRVKVPQAVQDLIKPIGSCNFLVVFLMAGVVMDLKADRKEMGAVIRFLILKYGIGAVVSALVYFFLPVPLMARQAAVFCIMAPPAAASIAFLNMLRANPRIYTTVYTLSMVISLLVFGTLGSIWY